MEDSPQKSELTQSSESQKQQMKERVTQLFNNFNNKVCPRTQCINRYCNHFLSRELGKDRESLNKQDYLKAAVKLVKSTSKTFEFPACWPPEPLNGEEVESLLEGTDDAQILTRITEVFCSLEALSLSFIPVSEGVVYNVEDCPISIDYIRLNKIYDKLIQLTEMEEGIYEKLFSDSIQNISSQLNKLNKSNWKYIRNGWIRVLIIWLSQERLYDPVYETITTLVVDFFYQLEDTQIYDRIQAETFMSKLENDKLLTIAKVIQQQLTFLLFDQPEEDSEEIDKVKKYFLMIDFLFNASRHK